MLLEKLHDYIAEARRELEAVIGTKLCVEHCCCVRSTPFVSRIEAEYIISRSGYYSSLVGIAEEWLLQRHECAPTYLADLPGADKGALANMPLVANEYRALARTRSPFLVVPHGAGVERLLIGPWAKNSYATGAFVQEEALDLLGETQPLVCATSGLFTSPPEWCHRAPGLGESANVRAVADPGSLKRHYAKLSELVYQRHPDKAQFGLLPAMIVRVANPMGFQRWANEGRIALAKLAVGKGPPIVKLWEGGYAGKTERTITNSAAGATGGTRGR